MQILTIPKQIAGRDDLVVIPRKEYEALLKFKSIREFAPTVSHKKALARAEANLAKGKTLSYNDLVKNLGFAN